MKLYSITAAILGATLPAFAQDHAPAPATSAPVDEIAPISDTIPEDEGESDSVSAQLSCTFITECVDNKCTESDYQGRLTIITDGAGLAEAEWADGSDTVAMSAIIEQGTTLASYTETESTPFKQRLLTIAESGEARFTTHLTAPVTAISYIGSCEITG